MNLKNKKIDTRLVRSINKNVRSSTRKLKPLLKSIVGKKASNAMRDLSFSEKRISNEIKKTISSAVANAENNYQYDIDKLVVKEAYCGKQIIMKRFRATPIIKPYSNVTIILTEKNLRRKHGSKSNPVGLRLDKQGWDSVWYAKKSFGNYLIEDFKIREFKCD